MPTPSNGPVRPQTFTKRPVSVDAIHWREDLTPVEAHGITGFLEHTWHYPMLPASGAPDNPGLPTLPVDGGPDRGIWIDPADGDLMIRTLEGDMRVSPGDWIIRGLTGEIYPCKPDIFRRTYVPACIADAEREDSRERVTDDGYVEPPGFGVALCSSEREELARERDDEVPGAAGTAGGGSVVADVSSWARRTTAYGGCRVPVLLTRIADRLSPLLRDDWGLDVGSGRIALHRVGAPGAVAAVEVDVAVYCSHPGPFLVMRRPGEQWDRDTRFYGLEVARRIALELVSAAPEAWMHPGVLRAAEWAADVYGLLCDLDDDHTDLPGGRRVRLSRADGWHVTMSEVVTTHGRLLYRVAGADGEVLGTVDTASDAVGLVITDLCRYQCAAREASRPGRSSRP